MVEVIPIDDVWFNKIISSVTDIVPNSDNNNS